MGNVNNQILAAAARPQQAPTRQLLLFRLGDLRLGIDVQLVDEVARDLPLSIPFPEQGALLGLTVVRGEPTPVIDIGQLLSVATAERDRRLIVITLDAQSACLLVDRIDGLADCSCDSLEAARNGGPGSHVDWLQSVARSPVGDLVGLLDLDRVLAERAAAPVVEEVARV